MWVFGKKPKGEFAKIMAAACVQRGYLEKFYDGTLPISVAGDYSDVKVIDAAGREIPWNEVCRIDPDEMKTLMSDVANRIYTVLARTVFSRTRSDDNAFWRALTATASTWKKAWGEPQKLDDFLVLYPAVAKAVAKNQKAKRSQKTAALSLASDASRNPPRAKRSGRG